MVKNIGLSTEKLIDVRNANIEFDERQILKNVNLQLSLGEFCYLTGTSGSGKSLLLKTLYGDLPLRSGEASVVDFDLKKLDHSNRHLFRRHLGIVLQDYFLFKSMNVQDNLDYVLRALGWPDKDSRLQRVKEVLMDVAMVKKIFSPIDELSGGEQQRVAIARAIINHPRLIIADEPAGKLDRESADELMYLFQSISRKHRTGVFFATHDDRLISKFPARTYQCKEGEVVDMG